MGLRRGLKRFFSNLLTKIFRKKVVQVVITPEMEIDEAMDRERAYKAAQLAAKEVENIKLREQLEGLKPEIDIAQELTEKREELLFEPYIGSFSFSKFYNYRNKMNKWKKFKVWSYDLKKDFGYFYDLLIIPDGRMSLIVKTYEGEIEPLITAKTPRELFMNFKGMVNSVGKGFFITNLDAEGTYMENILEKEIPDIITDAKGRFIFTKTTYPFSEILVKNLSDLNKAYEEIETYEEMARDQLRRERLLILQKKFAEERARIVEASEGKNFREVKEIYKEMANLIKENLMQAENKSIDNEIVNRLETVYEKLSDTLASEQSKDARLDAKEEVKDAINWATELKTGMLIEKEEEATPDELREKKFQEMKTKVLRAK